LSFKAKFINGLFVSMCCFYLSSIWWICKHTSPFTCVGTQLQRAVKGNVPQISNVLTGALKLSSAHAEATGIAGLLRREFNFTWVA